MWIPHNLLSPLKAESPKETIKASEAATDERTFVVGFFLCNAVTKAWETDVLVAPADSRREVVIGGKPCMAHVSANVAGKLHEIIYTVPATGTSAALAATYGHVCSELDRMALQYGRSFEIAGWRIADVEHEARWRCVPFRPSALIAEPDPGRLPAAYGEALRLYREARCATSAMWRLISAGAILDAAVSGRAPFDTAERDAASYALTTDMLVRSGALTTHPELKDGTARTLHELAEPRRRGLLVHFATLGGGEASASVGDYHAAASLAALANLVDLVARDLLLAGLKEGGYWRVAEKMEMMEPVSA